MFCPMAVDYGTIADWLSGIGTLAAVIFALVIAIRDARRAEKSRLHNTILERNRRNSLIDEVFLLLDEATMAIDSIADVPDLTINSPIKISYVNDVASVGARFLQLQSLERVNPTLFTEIGNLGITLSRVEADRVAQGTVAQQNAETLRTHIRIRSDLISDLREILNEADGIPATK